MDERVHHQQPTSRRLTPPTNQATKAATGKQQWKSWANQQPRRAPTQPDQHKINYTKTKINTPVRSTDRGLGAVRFVDLLAAAGLITWETGGDGRAVAVALTANGGRPVSGRDRRPCPSAPGLLGNFDHRGLHALDALSGTVLAGPVREAGAILRIYRLWRHSRVRPTDWFVPCR